jgi:dipeptidyl aminopeptidase/acylaminoacyl peptidase
LFLVSSGKAEDNGLFVGSLGQLESQRLSPDPSNAIYAPPIGGSSGHLLFRRDTTLMARPFNPDSLAFTGDAFPLAESVGNTANAGFGGFSVSDGGILAVGSRAGGKSQAVWWDRTGKRLEAVTQPALLTAGGMSLSPDEKKLANSPGDNDARDVWVQDLVRGAASRLTFGGSNVGPVWSPDGTRVAYGRRDPLGFIVSLFEKPASGEGAEKALLQPAGLNASPYDWSRDGNFIVYRVDGEKTGLDLWLLPLNGDRKPMAFLQTAAAESNARFSPDSKLVAYDSDESGQAQVYVQPVSKGGSKWQISTAGGTTPYWRRDGQEMYYIAPNRMLMAVPVKSAPSFEAGKPQPLFELASTNYLARGDGQRFLVLVPSADTPDAPPLSVMTNWLAGVGK